MHLLPEDVRALVARYAIQYALDREVKPDGMQVASLISGYLLNRLTAEELYSTITALIERTNSDRQGNPARTSH